MIRVVLHTSVACDGGCGVALGPVPSPATTPQQAVVLAQRQAVRRSWVRRLDGRLLCPACADVERCGLEGHEFGRGGGWLLCGCRRSLPAHLDVVDPAGGQGCGMTWRICGRCDHIEERPATEEATTTVAATRRRCAGCSEEIDAAEVGACAGDVVACQDCAALAEGVPAS